MQNGYGYGKLCDPTSRSLSIMHALFMTGSGRGAARRALADDVRALGGGQGVRDVGRGRQPRGRGVHTALLVLAGTRAPLVAHSHHVTRSAGAGLHGHLADGVGRDWSSNPPVVGVVTGGSAVRAAANLWSEIDRVK